MDNKIKELEEKLLRKEQECEAYKMEAEEGKEINAELKAELEALKSFDINLVGIKECEIRQLVQYRKTLTEIKEIVQFGFRPYKVCGEHNNCCDVLNEIWNKISEVESA